LDAAATMQVIAVAAGSVALVVIFLVMELGRRLGVVVAIEQSSIFHPQPAGVDQVAPALLIAAAVGVQVEVLHAVRVGVNVRAARDGACGEACGIGPGAGLRQPEAGDLSGHDPLQQQPGSLFPAGQLGGCWVLGIGCWVGRWSLVVGRSLALSLSRSL